MDELQTEVDVLAVFSHPDDAELTVAGTLLKMKAAGYRTGVVDVTRGEMGTRGTPETRASEAAAAARVMNLDVRLNLGLPDGHVWSNDESRRLMVRVIRARRPKILLTAHWDDPHPDHAHTAQIVREAARLASMRLYDEEAGQSAVKVPTVAYACFSRLTPPSFIVDVSDFVAGKMAAIRAYSSQFYQVDSAEPATRLSAKNFLQEVEWRMRHYGALIGVEAGEAYYVREALNVEDPIALLTRPMNIYS